MSKLDDSISLIADAIKTARRPAVMLSFGKDSMVLAHLIRVATNAPNEFPLDVIYHRDPWFAHKHEFADSVIRSWSMVVHDFPPMKAGVKYKDDMLELVARYSFGVREIDIPKNTLPPQARRDYICGLYDWINRPKSFIMEYPWDTVFIGHKSSDIDPFEGAVPLKYDWVRRAGVTIVFPLRHWTGDDVWEYIEEHHVPVQESRYENRVENEDKWLNNDYVNACTACIDPRETREKVYCPMLKRDVDNVSKLVPRLQGVPHYVGREE